MSEELKSTLFNLALFAFIVSALFCMVINDYNDSRILSGKKFILGKASYRCTKINELKEE